MKTYYLLIGGFIMLFVCSFVALQVFVTTGEFSLCLVRRGLHCRYLPG